MKQNNIQHLKDKILIVSTDQILYISSIPI